MILNLRRLTNKLGGRLDYGEPLFPSHMSSVQQRLDFLVAAACSNVLVKKPRLVVLCRIFVRVLSMCTRLAAERPLMRTVSAVNKVADRALLRTICSRSWSGSLSAFTRAPRQLLWQVGQVYCIQIGIGASSLETHGGYGEVFVGHLRIRVISVEQVDGAVDFLAHMSAEAWISERRKFLHAFLFEAGPQFSFPATLFAIQFVSASEFARKCAVSFAARGGQEIGNADVDADDRRRFSGTQIDKSSFTGTRSGWPFSSVLIRNQ